MASRREILDQLQDDYLRHLATLSGRRGAGSGSREDLIAAIAAADEPTTEAILNGLSLAGLQEVCHRLGLTGPFRSKAAAIQALTGGARNPAAIPPAGAARLPVQAVEKPIICSPYDEPNDHWIYEATT